MTKSLSQKLGSCCGYSLQYFLALLVSMWSPCLSPLLVGVSYTVCVLFVGASTLFKRSRVGAGGVCLGL